MGIQCQVSMMKLGIPPGAGGWVAASLPSTQNSGRSIGFPARQDGDGDDSVRREAAVRRRLKYDGCNLVFGFDLDADRWDALISNKDRHEDQDNDDPERDAPKNQTCSPHRPLPIDVA